MLAYQLRIAWLSLKRNPILSTLLVAAIALGVAISTTFVTVHHIYSGDPIPTKSDRLFHVEMDSWDPDRPFERNHPERPPYQVTYRDMKGIMSSDIPTLQSGMFVASLTVHPEGDLRPFRENVRMCFADFFPLYDVPFAFGQGWDAAADSDP